MVVSSISSHVEEILSTGGGATWNGYQKPMQHTWGITGAVNTDRRDKTQQTLTCQLRIPETPYR